MKFSCLLNRFTFRFPRRDGENQVERGNAEDEDRNKFPFYFSVQNVNKSHLLNMNK